MRTILIFGIAGAMLAACNGRPNTIGPGASTQQPQPKIKVDVTQLVVDTILLNRTDTAILVKDKPIADDMGDKRERYVVTIYFISQNWPTLVYDQAIGADLFLTGDLNGDQQPELLLRPEWFSSCWAGLSLFSLHGNTWKKVSSGSMYFCADNYPLAKRIIKTDQGYAMLTDSLSENRFITLKKNIKF